MIQKKYRDLSFVKRELVKQIEDMVKDKKEKLNVTILNFEKSDIKELNGLVRIGYYPSRYNDQGLIKISDWSEVDGKTLVKIKEKLRLNKFYGEKYIKGESCKVRIKT